MSYFADKEVFDTPATPIELIVTPLLAVRRGGDEAMAGVRGAGQRDLEAARHRQATKGQ